MSRTMPGRDHPEASASAHPIPHTGTRTAIEQNREKFADSALLSAKLVRGATLKVILGAPRYVLHIEGSNQRGIARLAQEKMRVPLLDRANIREIQLEVIGKRAGFTVAQMKSLLDAGMTFEEILDLMASRLASGRRQPVSCQDPLDLKE